MNKLFFITGASGAGKTTAVKNIQAENPAGFAFCFYDSIGVPSPEEMKRKFGSGHGWQKATTKYWVKKMKAEYLDTKSAILDGQARPEFIDAACKENGVTDYQVILFDCSDEERAKRLIKRGHPELVNQDMTNWAKFLREEAIKRGDKIIDTTNLSEEESKKELKNILGV